MNDHPEDASPTAPIDGAGVPGSGEQISFDEETRLTAVTDDPSNSSATRPLSVTIACVLLTAAILVTLPAVAWFGHSQYGMNGLKAAGLAAAICWAGAMIALVLVAVFRTSQQQMVSATLLGMLFRTGLPLLTGMMLTRSGGPIAEAGLFGMILVFYLVGLLVETILSVRLLGSSQTVAKAS